MNSKKIALAGNPNVGKSTVFNALTGLRQHTGNWAGKTVSCAYGHFSYADTEYTLVDLPGCYSLAGHCGEESVARDFICQEDVDAVIVVCDATCLERNLNLVVQILEITPFVLVCVNLLDEAARKHISVDLKLLSQQLGVPVVGTSARRRGNAKKILPLLDQLVYSPAPVPTKCIYPEYIEQTLQSWVVDGKQRYCLLDELMKAESERAVRQWQVWNEQGKDRTYVEDDISASTMVRAEQICAMVVKSSEHHAQRDRRIDRILTGRRWGIAVMLLMLMLIFWLTIVGANYPSQFLSNTLFGWEDNIHNFLLNLGLPLSVCTMLSEGMYRVLAWVVAVMLPPMAIFFPLFTLLEDLGYLPRIAFNLDKCFQKCRACGKQALTMCMGFGCNAVGVTGCRIIDSPRERLIAMLTNSFVPCNGRFPTLITIISIFFICSSGGLINSVFAAASLTLVIMMGILMTLLASWLLSKTLLRGMPSSFTLELPPYRCPQVGKVIVRSVLDRSLFVLGRAVAVAAPAGIIIWLLSNSTIGEQSALLTLSSWLDPFANLLGMDGIILLAFILGWPANEIVMPIIVMAYMAGSGLVELNISQLQQLLIANDWTWLTAACVMIFSLMHWPCATTCWTIKKESCSWKWTAVSVVLPFLMGSASCFILTSIVRLLGLV